MCVILWRCVNVIVPMKDNDEKNESIYLYL